MSKPLIVIPDDYPPVMGPSDAYQGLLERAEVKYYDNLPPNHDVLVDRIGDAKYAISIRSSIDFPRDILAACKSLELLSIWGTGTDHVDLEAASEHGIKVVNTPAVSAVSMAEHTLALMLSLARDIPRIDSKTRRGGWPRGFVTQLAGKTLGVIGLGAIGRQTARIAKGIGMRVIAWTMHPNQELADELGVELVELDALYARADVVSLHLRQSPETVNFVDAAAFERMKPTAYFINTARGAIVDEPAMVRALESGQIGGAALDVFCQEPLPEDDPLIRAPNVVMTPHSGGVTKEALEAGLALSIENIFAFIDGQPQNIVNP